MIQIESLPSLARKYKGAPLAVLWVLITSHQQLSQSHLESMTGYTDKTISSALQFLKNDGLIDHQPSGWQLTTSIQLELPSSSEDVERVQRSLQLESRRISDPFPEESRRISDPPIISNESINLVDELITNNYRNNSDRDVWDLLESVGVYHNLVTDQLAQKLTADQIRMAIRQLSLENKPLPANAGLLISRLKHPIKVNSDNEIDRAKRERYSEWEK